MINQHCLDALNECLCKAEALAVVATMTDINALNDHIVNDYLWTLSDIICEAKQLYDKAIAACRPM